MQIVRPETISEALELLALPETKAIAGGTNVMVDIKKGREQAKRLVSLDLLSELKCLEIRDGALHIGALVTFTELENFLKNCTDKYPAWQGLLEAAALVGGPQIRNRGTVGGNILCASPSSDSVPALLVLDAELVLRDKEGTRKLPLEGFCTGVRRTQLKQGELLTEIIVPAKPGVSCFYKAGARKAMAISVANQAMYLEMKDGVVEAAAIACGSVAPVVVRTPKTEELFIGKTKKELLESTAMELLRDSLQKEISPITDLRAEKEYREMVSCNILEENTNRLLANN